MPDLTLRFPLQAIARAYALGSCIEIRSRAGGTAGAGAEIIAGQSRYYLRRRSGEHIAPESIDYEHKLLSHLSDASRPVAAPLSTTDGSTFLEFQGKVYEVFPYIEGLRFTPGNTIELSDIGKTVGKFHRATENITRHKPGQRREDDPNRLQSDLRTYLSYPAPDDVAASSGARRVETLNRILGELQVELSNRVYGKLPQCVIHGDLHAGNVLYSDHHVTGLFDFDWANRQERLRDVGDGILFFVGIDTEERDPGDIWALTERPLLNKELLGYFVDGYARECAISTDELAALPAVMAARWLQTRIRGMRKVAPKRRYQFLDRNDLLEVVDEILSFTIS